jgi:hypothetical protein
MLHAARWASATFLVVVAAGACAGQKAPVESWPNEWENPMSDQRARFAFSSSEGARCELAGRTVLDAEIHLGASEYEPIADVGQKEVGVQVLTLAPRGSTRSKVRVRSVPSGPALVVEGWVENYALPLRLLRKVDASPGHVWFEQGSLVGALAGNGTRVRVGSGERCSSDYGVAVDVDCSALAVHEPVPDPPPSPAPQTRVEPFIAKRYPLALLDDSRRRVFDLDYGEIGVVDRAAALTRVQIAQSGLTIRGWVETSALVPPPDRSYHCMEPRDVVDRCPDFEEPLHPSGDYDGCRESDWEIREAVREVPLRLEPKLEARIVGFVEPGAKIRVPRSGTRFITVDGEPRTLGGRSMAPFWALASDVR